MQLWCELNCLVVVGDLIPPASIIVALELAKRRLALEIFTLGTDVNIVTHSHRSGRFVNHEPEENG